MRLRRKEAKVVPITGTNRTAKTEQAEMGGRRMCSIACGSLIWNVSQYNRNRKLQAILTSISPKIMTAWLYT
jgi:hypothetical protein